MGLLHDLRVRGFIERDGPEADELVADGYATRSGRRLVLTPAGRQAHDAAARLPAGSEEEALARRVYEQFGPLNAELLQLTTDWQVRPGNVPNDHTDATYDWQVVDRLRALDERVAPPVRRLERRIAQFTGYRDRLAWALAQVERGERDWFASPRVDSYHTVWMQLHEDLLLALGIERSAEVTP